MLVYSGNSFPGCLCESDLQNWLIMKNGDRYVGLFQGMFDKNILTFNPGWTSDAQPHFDLELAFPVKKMKGA